MLPLFFISCNGDCATVARTTCNPRVASSSLACVTYVFSFWQVSSLTYVFYLQVSRSVHWPCCRRHFRKDHDHIHTAVLSHLRRDTCCVPRKWTPWSEYCVRVDELVSRMSEPIKWIHLTLAPFICWNTQTPPKNHACYLLYRVFWSQIRLLKSLRDWTS